MMEFFLSKFWAFIIAAVILGVLVQGVQIDSRSGQFDAMDGLAEELGMMFSEFAAAGEGLETTVDLQGMLPATATLTMFAGYGLLKDGEHEVRFAVPDFTMSRENGNGERMTADRLVLSMNDSLRLANGVEGSTMTALSR